MMLIIIYELNFINNALKYNTHLQSDPFLHVPTQCLSSKFVEIYHHFNV